jgi:hypothetical protein
MPLVLFPNGSIARVPTVPKGGVVIPEHVRTVSPTIRANHTAAVVKKQERKNGS